MADHILAIDLNPLHWLGDAAGEVVGNVWKAAMTGLWSAALWILKLAFEIIDQFTTPDLTARGPMAGVLPATLGIGATLAGIMMFVQLTLALIRRDGQSMGRIFIGVGQFGLVWVGYLGIAAGMVGAAAGLSQGILSSMLHVRYMADFNFDESWPKSIDDITLATVLGILSILLVIPAAFFYVLIMLVREAALVILVATAPISAGGLLSDVGRVWFWKTLRWFFSCLLISPCAALLLGIGVKLSERAINHTPPPCAPRHCKDGGWLLSHAKEMADWQNANSSAGAGMAIVGCIVIAIGAVCPLILFRLLAFVEPGTASGAALRQSWSDTGGMSGLLRAGGAGAAGGSLAAASEADGRAVGESGAESRTHGRLAAALGSASGGMRAATSLAQKAADIGSDILGSAGVGSPGYSMTPTDERVSRNRNGHRQPPPRYEPSDDGPLSEPTPLPAEQSAPAEAPSANSKTEPKRRGGPHDD